MTATEETTELETVRAADLTVGRVLANRRWQAERVDVSPKGVAVTLRSTEGHGAAERFEYRLNDHLEVVKRPV